MGFPGRFVQLIMDYISGIDFAVMVNGEECGYIQPGKGLRQGDPLSPYLFILCMEGLIALINEAVEEGSWVCLTWFY
ncbi:hypothetical protein LIER_41464 [Lithospermum erythrorhizon]|uniref:Reverse transcriptase n=1 Tax=Lithospermum erythrorhizon TaxID=34254 RepID=A0AAV3RDQ4_LITER